MPDNTPKEPPPVHLEEKALDYGTVVETVVGVSAVVGAAAQVYSAVHQQSPSPPPQHDSGSPAPGIVLPPGVDREGD